jgi:hypothetical protein
LQALPIFLDKLADPVTAVLLSVTVVLVIGEILPQAVCRSYGLQVGSYSALFVRLLLFLAAPIAWPIGKVLDWLLGGEQTVREGWMLCGTGGQQPRLLVGLMFLTTTVSGCRPFVLVGHADLVGRGGGRMGVGGISG